VGVQIRPAVLNKDILTQAEVLIALRMTGPRDVAAIDDGCGYTPRKIKPSM